jgi:hypothetical protein
MSNTSYHSAWPSFKEMAPKHLALFSIVLGWHSWVEMKRNMMKVFGGEKIEVWVRVEGMEY